jgi:hypothetical protein
VRAYGRDDASDQLGLRDLSSPGAIEVDHVQPASAPPDEGRGRRDRVGPEHGLGVELAALEPHDLTATEVERSQDLEPHTSLTRHCLTSSL